MSRKESTVVIDAEGRDRGKVFHIREMPSEQAEAWGIRLMLALAHAGVEVPEGFFQMGMAGVAVMGLKAMGGLTWDVAKPLMDEMMACITIQPNPREPLVIRALIADDIEEVRTRVTLREEVINLHTGFSISGFLSDFKKLQEMRAMEAAAAVIGDNIETSPSSSGEWSPANLPH